MVAVTKWMDDGPAPAPHDRGQMNYVTETLAFFGGSVVVLGFVAWLTKTLIGALFARDLKTLEVRLKADADRVLESLKIEIQKKANAELETQKDRLQRERDQLGREAVVDMARNERIRQELHRWANPILGAVRDLRYRLENILEQSGYVALSPGSGSGSGSGTGRGNEWMIPYAYFMPSTLYLFAQYFHAIRRLQEELGFELFETHVAKDAFLRKIQEVSQALGAWPYPGTETGRDAPVFNLEQRGIAEAMTVRAEGARCLGFNEFMENWDDVVLSDRLQPLQDLMEALTPELRVRWARLCQVLIAVRDLEAHCVALLQPAARAG